MWTCPRALLPCKCLPCAEVFRWPNPGDFQAQEFLTVIKKYCHSDFIQVRMTIKQDLSQDRIRLLFVRDGNRFHGKYDSGNLFLYNFHFTIGAKDVADKIKSLLALLPWRRASKRDTSRCTPYSKHNFCLVSGIVPGGRSLSGCCS